MRLLFIHGAGGHAEDRVLASALADQLGATVEMPRLPDDDMSVFAWAETVRPALEGLGVEDVVVAHSFGATILLHVLAACTAAPASVALLAMPDWGPEGWDVKDYVPPAPVSAIELTLHHCCDDQVVPFAHLAPAS